jgi:2-dehydro-3-deoxyglucarate aldolase
MNRNTSLKRKLAAREPVFGAWVTLGHPAIAEIFCRAGLDWVAVDMEHSVVSLEQAEACIRTASLLGAAPLVRLSVNDPIQAKRVMDAGATGVIVPMVNSPAEAAAAVAAIHYPPTGKRGVGLARAQGYGADFPGYKEWLAENGVVIVQVEHIKAVQDLEAILAVKGVDGFIVGPYDLSGSLGVPGDFSHPDMLAAMERIREVGLASGKAMGFHVVEPDPELVNTRRGEGYTFVGLSLDIRVIDRGMRGLLAAVRDND